VTVPGVHYVNSNGPLVRATHGAAGLASRRSKAARSRSSAASSRKRSGRPARKPPTFGSHTLGGLIRDWRRSPEWERLAKSTRATWDTGLTRIEAKWGKLPLELWNDPRMVSKVVGWRDSMADRPRAADIGVTVLARLLEWGRIRARVQVNVAAAFRRSTAGESRAEIIWTAEDMDAFCRSALMLDAPLLIDALFLAAWTGMRLADLAAVTFEECEGSEAIVRKAAKKSKRPPPARDRPDPAAMRRVDRGAAHRPRAEGRQDAAGEQHGRQWSTRGLGDRFASVRDHAGIIHRSAG
jgi:hypothetical protein